VVELYHQNGGIKICTCPDEITFWYLLWWM